MGYLWLSNIPDKRTNHGVRRSWFFPSENEARADAVATATGKRNLDDATLELLWAQLSREGWRVVFEDPLDKDKVQ